MSLEAMLLLISAWCGEVEGTAKWACQSRMSKCVQAELKKNEKKLEPLFLRCWDREMK
jgi:hypothetical protein